MTFNESHETRFKYISEPPTNVTAKAFWNAFCGDGKIRQKVMSIMRRLREFSMSGLEIDSNDSNGPYQWSSALAIAGFLYGLEELNIWPSVSDTLGGTYRHLNLSTILHNSTSLINLRHLALAYVESPESLLVELFTQSSSSLVSVALRVVRITRSGSWSDLFRKIRNAEFKKLYSFVLVRCVGAKNIVRAENYLTRITDKDPIDESNEDQNDDSD